MYRLLLVLVLVLSLIPGASFATTPPQRLIETLNGETPVRVTAFKIDAELSGGLSETTVEITFFNPNARPVEGQLQFPLLPSQRITAFALDFDGRMRPAVPVEKAKGRQIFESIERRQVDPGLLETTQGNNFRLRIYPINPMGTRTVRLQYSEPLGREQGNWVYQLPLAYGDDVRSFDLAIKVHGTDVAPKATGGLGDVTFRRTGDGFQANVSKNAFHATSSLKLLVPANSAPVSYVQEHDGETYFVAEVPVGATTARVPRALPKTVGLLWDSSGSGSARHHQAELAVLDRYFKALRNAEVCLIRLRDRAESPESFRIVDGNWSALRDALQKTVYDGASALGDWQPQPEVGEYLLVSDGLMNYGTKSFPTLAPGQRLYALNSALSADTGRLTALAERSGGRMIQVMLDNPGMAAQALLAEGVRLVDMQGEGVTDLEAESHDPQHGMIRVAGRLRKRVAELRLTIAAQGKTHTLTVPIKVGAAVHPLAAHLWASYRLQALEADYEWKRAEIRRIGQQFGLPTRETSLIVLDRLEDYVRYDVMPPTAYRAAYEQIKSARGEQLRQARVKHLEDVVHEFSQKVTWWEKSYPKGEPLKPKEAAALARRQAAGMGDPIAPGSATMMAPAPAASPEARARSRTNMDKSLSGADSMGAANLKQESGLAEVGITLKKWTPDAPYIARMKAASPDKVYAIYLDEKPDYLNSSAFFLDAADILLEKGQRDLALRVLSNLVEMDLENRHVLRILGYRLLQAGASQLAVPVFEEVLRLAEEEPQSFRDLGLAYAAVGRYQEAIDQLNEVVVRTWDSRFAEIELITLAEMNAIIATVPSSVKLELSHINARLLKNMPLDLRAVLTWDADNSDMDLWVTDPNGEKCYYGNRFTYQGGRLSRDATGGYGPEEFSLRHAKPGKYKVEANFYGHRQQIVAGAATLQLKLTSGFGTKTAKEQMVTLRLRGNGDTVFVGEFEVKPK